MSSLPCRNQFLVQAVRRLAIAAVLAISRVTECWKTAVEIADAEALILKSYQKSLKDHNSSLQIWEST